MRRSVASASSQHCDGRAQIRPPNCRVTAGEQALMKMGGLPWRVIPRVALRHVRPADRSPRRARRLHSRLLAEHLRQHCRPAGEQGRAGHRRRLSPGQDFRQRGGRGGFRRRCRRRSRRAGRRERYQLGVGRRGRHPRRRHRRHHHRARGRRYAGMGIHRAQSQWRLALGDPAGSRADPCRAESPGHHRQPGPYRSRLFGEA
jgi:hypothetical protein